MSYIRDSPDNQEALVKEFKEEQGLKINRMQKRLREHIQSDEQTKINKYSEGFCYGCAKTDQILPGSLFNMCTDCMQKRGKEGLYAIQARIWRQELCDFCGFWKFNILQINCGLCLSCMRKIHRLHRKYRQGGGQFGQNPYYKNLQRKYGKDWILHISGGRNLGI